MGSGCKEIFFWILKRINHLKHTEFIQLTMLIFAGLWTKQPSVNVPAREKNSKLIYENDIAKDEKGNLYKVFWQKNYYQYSWICIKSNYLPVGAQWNLWSIKSFEIEVIGNVFDNKYLLESEE